MKILAITACPVGVAHTYMAKKALEIAAEKLGHQIKVEAQGAMGIENEITQSEADEADVIILASEVAVQKSERFKGKPCVKVPISQAIKSPENIINLINEKMKK